MSKRVTIVVTDHETGVTKGVTVDLPVAQAMFDAAVIGLDGADETGTPYSNRELHQAWTRAIALQEFIRD